MKKCYGRVNYPQCTLPWPALHTILCPALPCPNMTCPALTSPALPCSPNALLYSSAAWGGRAHYKTGARAPHLLVALNWCWEKQEVGPHRNNQYILIPASFLSVLATQISLKSFCKIEFLLRILFFCTWASLSSGCLTFFYIFQVLGNLQLDTPYLLTMLKKVTWPSLWQHHTLRYSLWEASNSWALLFPQQLREA